MILLVLTCLFAQILAYQRYENFYDRNYNPRSIIEHLYNNNFSEDEINAINEYKKGRNFRASTRKKVFEPEFENRRVFGWINNLLKKEEPKQLKYEDLVNNKIFYLRLARNLTENLSQLTQVLDKFTKELKDTSLINATFQRSFRRRRSVSGSEGLAAKNTANVTDIAVATEKIEKENATSERRMLNILTFNHKIMKSINDTLNIVLYKLSTASNAQKVFGDNLIFNIGFMSGSAITLKSFMNELQSIYTRSEKAIDQNYIMQLYETVNKANAVSTKLLDQLNLYTDKATKDLVKS